MTQHPGGATPRGPLPPIKFAELADALLSRASQVLPAWLPGGVFKGNEYFVHSFWRDEKTPSLSIRVKGERAGQWADHGGDRKGGDLVALYAAIHGMDQGAAALQVARAEGLEDVAGVQRARGADGKTPAPLPPPVVKEPARQPVRDVERWTALAPVPATALATTFWHFEYNSDKRQAVQDHIAEYRRDADLYGYVVRFIKTDGKKEPLPHVFAQSDRDGSCKWVWKALAEPRPLYLPLHTLADGTTLVLVEGEKKADALQTLLDAGAPGVYTVVAWAGGCKAWEKANWSWLAGRTVLCWPDCDSHREPLSAAERKDTPDLLAREVIQQGKPYLVATEQPGLKYMTRIAQHLRDAHGCTVQLLPVPAPGVVADGWDCADAINTDGWDCARVQAFFGTAAPVPPTPGGKGAQAAAGGDGGGKKIEGPGGPEDGASGGSGGGGESGGGGGGDDDGEHIAGKWVPRWLAWYWDGDKQRWLVSRKMVITVLERDGELRDVLGLNELSNNIEARIDWPWLHGKAGPVKASVEMLLGNFLTRKYGLPSIPRAALQEAIETVAHTRPFHPVREYLQGLEWDGVQRRDKWLIHCMGESPKTLKSNMRNYLQLVGRFMLIGMVNRVMDPGCKFDYCPVLEGAGGLGKSTFVKVLASKVYFSGAHFDLSRGKDGQEQVQGIWVYELQELSSFGKAEINLIKSFISNEVDRYRPSYGRVVEAFPRQCVLVGTTNEQRYLRDRTGNRRFWPLPVRHRLNIPWLTKWRDQLLAEAYALFLQDERFNPTPEEEEALFVPMQESRLEETAVHSELLQVLTRVGTAHGIGAEVNGLADFVTIAQLTRALGMDAAKSGQGLAREIGSWMKHQGWELKKRTVNGARAMGYVRPPNWPPNPLDQDAGDWTEGLTGDVDAPGAAGSSGLADVNDGNGGDDDAPF